MKQEFIIPAGELHRSLEPRMSKNHHNISIHFWAGHGHSTSMYRTRRVFWHIFPSKCASRHNGVQFVISHLPRCLRTRRFIKPTRGHPGATTHWKNAVFPTFLPFRAPASSFSIISDLLHLASSPFRLPPCLSFFLAVLFICAYRRKFHFLTSFDDIEQTTWVWVSMFLSRYRCCVDLRLGAQEKNKKRKFPSAPSLECSIVLILINRLNYDFTYIDTVDVYYTCTAQYSSRSKGTMPWCLESHKFAQLGRGIRTDPESLSRLSFKPFLRRFPKPEAISLFEKRQQIDCSRVARNIL